MHILHRITISNNSLGTELIKADEGVIEFYEPANVVGQSDLTLGMIVHGYQDLKAAGQEMIKALNSSGGCNMDVNCLANDGSGWEFQRNSVGMLVNGGGYCTGSLINNTNNDGIPYFITANHCGANHNSSVFRFRWEVAPADVECATGNDSPNGPENMNVNGSSVVATIEESDIKLVLLNSSPDPLWNIYYNGWDNSDLTGNVSNTRGIHHPAGDIKKICVDDQAPTQQNTPFNGFNTDVWRIADWDQGVTEPGSSGSPLFRQDGKTIGVLSGGAAACSGTNDNGQYDIYGRLGPAWEPVTATNAQLKFWLDPTNSGITEIDGYDPNASLDPDDASITSIVSPDGTYCSTTITPEVVLRNAGANNLTTATISYQIDAGAMQTYSWTGNLTPNSTENVVLPNMTTTGGAHTFSATSSLPNGNADTNTNNDNATNTFTTIAGSALPVSEGFETAALPATWSVQNGDNNGTWERETTYGGYGTSSSCYKIDNYNYNGVGQFDWLFTDYYDFSSTNAPELSFAYAYYQNTGGTTFYYDTLIVAYTTDCGGNWSSLFWEGGVDLATAAGDANEHDFTSTEWATEDIDIPVVHLGDVNF